MALNLGQTKFLQPLRSNAVYTSMTEAINSITALTTELSTLKRSDGTSVVARYEGNGGQIKTIVGVFANIDGKPKGFTFYTFDKEQSDALVAKVESLEGAVGENGSVSTQITNAIADLDSVVSGGTKVKVQVDQVDGKITAVTVDETALESKFTEVDGKIASAETAAKAAATKIVEKADGHVTITSASDETTGALTYTIAENDIASDAELKALSGQVKTIGDDYLKAADKAELEKKLTESVESYSIKQVTDGLAANVKEQYVLVKTTKTVTETGTTETTTDLTDTPIKIYKDSSLKDVQLVPTVNDNGVSGHALEFTYILADGTESKVPVDVSQFLAESEFADGLEVVNGIVKVKIDAADEGFLKTASGRGVYTEGIKTAIENAQSSAITHANDLNIAMEGRVKALEGAVGEGGSVSVQITEAINKLDKSDSAETGSYVTHVTQEDGIITTHKAAMPSVSFSVSADTASEHKPKIVYNIVQTNGALTAVSIEGQDLASASEVAELTEKVNGINDVLSATTGDTSYVKAVTVNGVDATVADNKATVTIDGSDIALSSDYTAVTYSAEAVDGESAPLFTAVTASTTVDSAINQVEKNVSKLVDEVLKNEKTTAAALTQFKESAGFNENGEYVKATASTYVSGASSLSSADALLDAAIKVNADSITAINKAITTIQENITNVESAAISVNAGNGIAVVEGGENNTEKTISVVIPEGNTLLAVNKTGIVLQEQGYIDCGTF